MVQNSPQPTPTNQPASSDKQAQLVVAWYQQKLAEAEEQLANVWAQNIQLTESLKAATSKNDPNS